MLLTRRTSASAPAGLAERCTCRAGAVLALALALALAPSGRSGTALAQGAAAGAEASDAPPTQSPEKMRDDALKAGLDPTVAEGVPDMAYVVADVATGKVLAESGAGVRRYPASTTKLMTANLAFEALRSGRMALDSPVVMTRRAAEEAPAKMGFAPGTVLRLDQALHMMLVKSANDVAYAIGQALGDGSMERFVAEMNATASRLGMDDTRFVNPNGLPQPGQYATPKDMAILARHIRRTFPAFSGYFSTEAIRSDDRLMRNGNKLLGQFDGADGMKTGYICASGFNLVSSATRDGRTIVAVVFGANGTRQRERLSAALLETGFDTDPADADRTLEDLPDQAGEPLDISGYICSQDARTARANARVADRESDLKYGSPFLTDKDRAPAILPVHRGGARGRGNIPPAVAMIESYGIPLPTPRPEPPALPLQPKPVPLDDVLATSRSETPQANPDTAPADARTQPANEPADAPPQERAEATPDTVPSPDVRPLPNADKASPSDPQDTGDEETGTADKTGRLEIYLDGAVMRPASHAMPDARQ